VKLARQLTATLAITALLGCASPLVPLREAPVPVHLSDAEQGLVEAVNRQRADLGLPLVAIRHDLVCAARAHSEDLVVSGDCTHDGSGGSTPESRVAACQGPDWDGEIVACGQRSPSSAVAAWMKSATHRDVIVDPDLRTVGVAMRDNYWTAVFSF